MSLGGFNLFPKDLTLDICRIHVRFMSGWVPSRAYRTKITITAINEQANPKRNDMAVVVQSFFFVG